MEPATMVSSLAKKLAIQSSMVGAMLQKKKQAPLPKVPKTYCPMTANCNAKAKRV
jgi:hypothetical protein